MKKFLLTGAIALALSVPVAMIGTAAQAAHTVTAADYLTGKIESMNQAAKSIKVSGHDTFGYSAADMSHLNVGDEVELTYVIVNNQFRVIGIKHFNDDRVEE